jgi:hypothetical protein
MIEFFGLLYIQQGESTGSNSQVKQFDRLIAQYVKNAVGLSNSLATAGIQFTLLTNRLMILERELELLDSPILAVSEIPFPLDVPSGIAFYSAHHKIDVFGFLGGLDSHRYVGILDLDMIAFGEVPSIAYLLRHHDPGHCRLRVVGDN